MSLRRWLGGALGAGLLLAAGATWAAWWLGPRTLLAVSGLAATHGRAEAAARRVSPALRRDFAAAGLTWGAPLLLRSFKLESTLELWAERDGRYVLFRSYPICAWSGGLGPKLRQGDRQAPEGFYRVGPGQMNPASRYHLSFDLGYPNAYDRAHARNGDYLMVHGSCVSVGCYALGDAAIEEVYTLMSAAFASGSDGVPVHAFPFRFDRDDRAQRLADPRWGAFWHELAAGWDAFETARRLPAIAAADGHYVVTPVAP
jgi:murein L,D-transpeptidase YafK